MRSVMDVHQISDSLSHLHKRKIDGSVAKKFKELSESGFHPVCLFPTRKACEEHNMNMLSILDAKLEHLICTDEIDETTSTRKWSKKAYDALKKLNKDCNLTAGLEAELVIAIGARVMLRRNLDTKRGLVNGSLGTVTAISSQHVTVKFYHISEPCPIERVRSKFMLMKSYYIYRKQYPLILAYAITIHKCQGLSLNSAIIDLSNKVFSPGMAYVALSRVRSLNGLHLTNFDPSSIMVSETSLKEVNRLRGIYRKDLSLYDIPESKKVAKKRKFVVTIDSEAPPLKKPCKEAVHKRSYKRKASFVNSSMKSKILKVMDDDCCITSVENDHQMTVWPDLRFYPIDVTWQHQACDLLGVQFRAIFDHQPGGPDTILTRPDHHSLYNVKGDGNCLFRTFSYMITGTEDQHLAIRSAVVQHMLCIPHLLIGNGTDGEPNAINLLCHPRIYESVEQYISSTRMDHSGTWGTNVEMLVLAHKLNTPVYCYDTSAPHHIWAAYFSNGVNRRIYRDIRKKSLYIYFSHDHFLAATAIQS